MFSNVLECSNVGSSKLQIKSKNEEKKKNENETKSNQTNMNDVLLVIQIWIHYMYVVYQKILKYALI